MVNLNRDSLKKYDVLCDNSIYTFICLAHLEWREMMALNNFALSVRLDEWVVDHPRKGWTL